MDLQQLRYVVALAREGNFQKAARTVGITQPTLSQQIKKLEEELGVYLFERSPRRVSLTQAGNQFVVRAQQALEVLEVGKNEIKQSKKSLEGTLRVAFIPTIGPYLLPPILKRLQKKAPNLHLKLSEETTNVLVDQLKSGRFDLGIISLPIGDPPLAERVLGEEEFLLAVSKSHPFANQASITVSSLKKERLLILKEGHCFRDQALEFCRRTQSDPQVIFEGSSLASVLNLVIAGIGVTLVPKIAAKPHLFPQLAFLPFRKPKPSRKIGAVWRMTALPSFCERFFLDEIERYLKK